MLSIGEFSKMTGLSLKTLRLYHEKGLLSPAQIDPWTRYRFYDHESLERARLIIQLRHFAFSLSDIREIVACCRRQGDLLGYLKTQRRVIEEKLKKYNTMLNLLDLKIESEKEVLMGQSIFKIEKNYEERFQSWLSRQSSINELPNGYIPNFTISSLCGEAGGDALAVVLSKRLGFAIWEEEMLSYVLAAKGREEALMATLEQDQWDEADVLVRNAIIPEVYAEKGEIYHKLKTLSMIALHGRSIFLELGGNYLLTSEKALRVRLDPSFKIAASHYAKIYNAELATTLQEMRDKEKKCQTAIQLIYGNDSGSAGDYDIVLNSATLDLYSATELVIQAFEARFHPTAGWWYT